ncbi:MAG: twin-arginine translocase subunit TatC [Flavobacteriales bacterium]|nr:twin-arginine translocase subunit TatC [Flavobacteriales bacterium]|tara:strand:- start:19669 stop:20448 length:780 start_codon:yes stop_codon:yes gene_type:complete
MSTNQNTEFTFLKHLEILRWHLVRSIIAILFGTIIAFFNKSFLFDKVIFACKENSFPTYVFLCKLSEKLCIQDMPFILMNVEMSGQFMMHILVSFAAGLILAFPYILIEIWKFISPAMYSAERYNTLVFFFSSLFLFFLGLFFGYFIIVPFSINFLSSYNISFAIENKIHFISFIKTITKIVLTTAFLFQLPVIVYFLTKFGIVTPSFLKNYRRHAFVIILILASILTPPDVFSQILIGIPIFCLYELSIFISIITKTK